MREAQSQFPESLVNRGVEWQAAGFTLTGIACLLILKSFEGSDFWLYQWFEKATVDLYWSFIVPLAFLFDWVRKMFESAKAIREAKKSQIREKAIRDGMQKGTQEENQRIRKLLEQHGIDLPPDVAEAVFGNKSENASCPLP